MGVDNQLHCIITLREAEEDTEDLPLISPSFRAMKGRRWLEQEKDSCDLQCDEFEVVNYKCSVV